MPPYQYQFPQRNMVNQSEQARIEGNDVPRSTFINQWTRKSNYSCGWLYPILVDEILPGDHMRYDVTAYLRMSTPLFPFFDMLQVDTHFFFTPSRILWDDWERFIAGTQVDPNQAIDIPMCHLRTLTGGDAIGQIVDHFGLSGGLQGQCDPGQWRSYCALPFRAYNRIWNDWFRDENTTNSVVCPTDSVLMGANSVVILPRNKGHDYFTSCLPWPQKFSVPNVPIVGNAPVIGIGAISQVYADLTAPPIGPFYESGGGSGVVYNYGAPTDTSIINQFFIRGTDDLTGYPAIYADMSVASGVSINTLRQAWMLQTLVERDARGGTRYVESIRNHFRVISPDFRLNRPEYIGGGSSEVSITPIAQTAEGANPLGSIGAAGTAVGQHRASYAATEHGWIIGLISIKSEQSYQYGQPKMFTRETRYEYYWPATAQLGEQAVLNDEIYSNGTTDDEIVFGYQERWAEYRTKYSDVTGIMRSFATGTLDAWHLAQAWTGAPTLGPGFLHDDPPMARVLAAGGSVIDQQFIASILYRRTAVRPIPTFSTPASLSRF